MVHNRVKHRLQLVKGYAVGLIGLRRDDVFLSSFPRSGSTWVRFLLCNLVSLSELDGRKVDFHFLDDTMPALGASSLLAPWRFETVPRFVKTHQPYHSLLFAVPQRVVYVLRDPRDVMVSYYNFQSAHLWRPFQGSFADFIRHPRYGLQACIRHYLSWLPHSTVVICYEELLKDTVAEFRRMLTVLQIPVRDEFLKLAVEKSSFRKIRSVQEESGLSGPQRFGQQFQFARKGKSRQWPDYFSSEDLALYERIRREHGFNLYT